MLIGAERALLRLGANSNADSPTVSPKDGSTVFVKPHEEDQSFEQFLEYIVQQESDPDFPANAEVRYAQTRESIAESSFRH